MPTAQAQTGPGAERQSEAPSEMLPGGQGWVHRHRRESVSLACFNVTRSLSGEGTQGEVVQ